MLGRSLAAALILTIASGAQAVDIEEAAAPASSPQLLDQRIYKGVAGNLLDTVPIDPQARVTLQRANAVISNSLSGRSLAIILGVTNPVFMIGGLVWGIWSAMNISSPLPDTSWLSPRQYSGPGFCTRPLEACQLHIHYCYDIDPESPVERTFIVTSN